MVSATARNKVQTLVKAMCLSRKKTELLDGKPLVVLPERIVNVNVNQFDEDERNFYDVMFKRAQAKFNKFRREGTIMKNYSSVLVLLLRLRQCCCHPSLATVFGDQIVAAAGDIVELEKLLLDGMPNDVVQRVINNNEQMECPVCFDAIDHANGKIIQMCGHCFCNECCDNLLTSTRLCPHCRGNMERDKILTLHSFLKKYNPSALKNEEEYLAKEEVVKKEDELLKKNDWVSSTKIEALISCIKKSMETNADDKIIVFSQFVAFLDLIELPLRKLGIKYVRYDGSMSTKTRSEAVEQLKKDKETRLILISLKCGSLGLNLTCANRVILMDVWWNPAIENQAIDRAHRMGQTKDVYVERIVIQNSIEDRILELQTQKQQLSDGIMGHGEFGNQRQTRLSIDQLMRLFRDQDA
ncbi:hypothetical protein HDU92_007515 [Lobulomyces angularis]|nr:hypothetical protein HDU92_007515 [Lobulomyces angularis]